MKASRQYQNRTAIIYFGSTKQDYLKLVKAESHRAYLDDAQPFLKEQLLLEMHHDGCNDSSCDTIHRQPMRSLICSNHLKHWPRGLSHQRLEEGI